MRRSVVAAAFFWAAACKAPAPDVDAGVEPSAKPHVERASVADQRKPRSSPQVLPGIGGETDGREVDAGASFHEEAKKGCSDIKCVGDNCARLCAKWTSENSSSVASGDVRNKVYFGCLGTCITEVDQ